MLLIKWCLRAWPLIIFAPIIFMHESLIQYFPLFATTINHTITLISQFGGALLILYSINSNFYVLKQKSLLAILTNFFKEFPLNKKSISIELQGNATATATCSGNLSMTRNPQTLEDKIDYLQEQINELSNNLVQKTAELNNKIEGQSKENNTQIQVVTSSLKNLKSNLHKIYTEGIQTQLFGILLMLYSSITDYII